MIKGNLKRIFNENGGKLPIEPYNVNFLGANGRIYCYDCAMDLIDDEYIDLIDIYIHFEGKGVYCGSCGAEIESEY